MFVFCSNEGGDMDADIDTSRMSREIHAMPEEVRVALEARGLVAEYRRRPAY